VGVGGNLEGAKKKKKKNPVRVGGSLEGEKKKKKPCPCRRELGGRKKNPVSGPRRMDGRTTRRISHQDLGSCFRNPTVRAGSNFRNTTVWAGSTGLLKRETVPSDARTHAHTCCNYI
jgi:hypothetical protein